MRIAIASRIFSPEPSAASFRLEALAEALADAGHQVTVFTVKPPKSFAVNDRNLKYKVKRAPVLRDKAGYVRGYLQYMSFDIPLFFRMIFTKRFDAIIVEPPPTTGFVVRIISFLKRTPYFYYAADIWSDAAAQTGAPQMVLTVLKNIERFALRGATSILSVSDQVTKRLEEIGISKRINTIGNGIDTSKFSYVSGLPANESPVFVYNGTASELHGADIFVKALPEVLEQYPNARIRFIGGGSEKGKLENLAASLGVSESVIFEQSATPTEIRNVLSTASSALASLRPGFGYDFAFPTKLYGAASCGSFLIFSGVGPAVKFVHSEVQGMPIGIAVSYETQLVAKAMIDSLRQDLSQTRRQAVSRWAKENVSLQPVTAKIIEEVKSRLATA